MPKPEQWVETGSGRIPDKRYQQLRVLSKEKRNSALCEAEERSSLLTACIAVVFFLAVSLIPVWAALTKVEGFAFLAYTALSAGLIRIGFPLLMGPVRRICVRILSYRIPSPRWFLEQECQASRESEGAAFDRQYQSEEIARLEYAFYFPDGPDEPI